MTDAEKQNLINLLDSLVLAAVPKASKVAKYAGTLWSTNLASGKQLGCDRQSLILECESWRS